VNEQINSLKYQLTSKLKFIAYRRLCP